ncbi:MAG: chorismate synthase [Nitrospiraceae bacterium]|nr:chorismate synthase [Nitrospiraceae bacterium]
MLEFYTAGESHGKGLAGIIQGIPAGLAVSGEDINGELKRRQKGYGRGGRMKIESDRAEIISGIRWGRTIGSPISIFIQNRDWKNWEKAMSSGAEDEGSIQPVTRPRPGHADLPGALKFAQPDIRNILERSSARETAMRVALGAVAKKFLLEFGISIGSYVFQIGKAKMKQPSGRISAEQLLDLLKRAEESQVSCPDEETADRMKEQIDRAMEAGDSMGGRFTVFAVGAPVGLGSHTQWDRRLDGRLAQALMSVQAIKAVEAGGGIELASKPGSQVMDEIFYGKDAGFFRKTDRMGGIEGGMTNGMPILLHAAMKPIPTLRKPLASVDMKTKEPFEAAYERSDVCAVPAAAVVAEAMTALIIAGAFLEKFGGDSITETGRNYDGYKQYLRGF